MPKKLKSSELDYDAAKKDLVRHGDEYGDEELEAQIDAKLAEEIDRKMGNSDWRINNLYHVLDANGKNVVFKLNRAQREFVKERMGWDLILKARQMGFSTYAAIFFLDKMLHTPNYQVGIIDKSLDDAKKKLEKIIWAYEHLDQHVDLDLRFLGQMLKKQVTMDATKQEIRFSNGSSVYIGTSLRGGTLQGLHLSEIGYVSAFDPGKAIEIRSGALNAVHEGSDVFVESTHEGGRTGVFYELTQAAKKATQIVAREGRDFEHLEWKFHFFNWQWDDKYEFEEKRGYVYRGDLEEYFEEMEGKGIFFTEGQKKWYALKCDTMGEDAMHREFPTHEDEVYESANKYAYYGSELKLARAEGRISRFAIMNNLPVDTFWDIGISKGNATTIWFVQQMGNMFNICHYLEHEGLTGSQVAGEVRQFASDKGFFFGTHFLPHDGKQRGKGDGLKYSTFLKQAGLKSVYELPRVHEVNYGINLTKDLFNRLNFDEKNCEVGLKHLANYHKTFIDERGIFKPKPEHDESSNAADSLRQLAWAVHLRKVVIHDERIKLSGARKRREKVMAKIQP